MNDFEASERLKAHALKTELPGETGGPCFGVALCLIERGSGSLERLRVSFRDVLSCLEVINRSLNGDVPSTTFCRARPLDFDVVYAVEQILHDGWQLVITRTTSETEMSEMFRIFWAISYAWGSVLAGDIDCIKDELRIEAQVRGIDLDLG